MHLAEYYASDWLFIFGLGTEKFRISDAFKNTHE